MSTSSAVNVSTVLDERGIGRYQLFVIALCGLVLIVEGFEAQAISYVAPVLLKVYGVDKSSLGPVFSAALFGVLIGSLLSSPFADYFGRKYVVMASVAVFAFGSLLMATAHSIDEALIYRLITGIGIGGAIPNTIALASDYCPKRLRARTVMIVSLHVAFGGAIGGPISVFLIQRFGWESVFYFGAGVPLLLIVVLAVYLPESVRLLVIHGGQNAKVAGTLRRIEPTRNFSDKDEYYLDEPRMPGVPLLHLFRDGRSLATLLLWFTYFCVFAVMFSLRLWLPVVITSAGHTLTDAIWATSAFSICGVIGGIWLGRYIDRFGGRALALGFLFASFFIVLIGTTAGSPEWILIPICGVAGFFLLATEVGMNGFTTGFYPTAIRSSGLGWAGGVGRSGAAIGPLVGGMLLSSHWSMQSVFLIAAVPALIAAATIWLVSRLSTGTMEKSTSVETTVAPKRSAAATNLG
jgi:AAHS family 4-hydroxybenzoate transporter-like MFS transporter